MRGKTVVITGATSGIGLEAAVALAREGARVVLVGRNPGKTAAAVAEVRKRSGSATVESLLCDFSSLESIRKLAGDLRARCERIDVLVNNAGAVYPGGTLTGDRIESTFAVNHLGYFLLTNLLTDLLVKSAPARIVNVASVAHYRGTLDFRRSGLRAGLPADEGVRAIQAGQRALHARAGATALGQGRHGERAASGNGGHGHLERGSGLGPACPGHREDVHAVARGGSARIVYLASSPEVAATTGSYFEKDRPRKPARLAEDDALASRLWSESARLVGLDPVASRQPAS